MGTVSDKLPVIAAIEDRDRADDERRREIHARCKTIERACRAIGFGAEEGYERVATLVARVAGHGVLVRTAGEISQDPDVAPLSISQVRRAIDELERFGVLVVEKDTVDEGGIRRRGRRTILYKLQVNSERIGQVLNEVRELQEKPCAELTARSPHDPRTIAAESAHDSRTIAAESPHVANHSYSNPLSHLPGPNPKGSDGRPDQICVRTFKAEEVAASAERLFVGLGYNGEDGRTIWQVAAAYDAGLLSEHQIRDASRAAGMMAKTNRLGYFRTVLAERCETDAEGLRRILAQVRIEGGFPSKRPQAKRVGVPVRFQAVPKAVSTAATSDVVANERRDELLRGLVTAARSGA